MGNGFRRFVRSTLLLVGCSADVGRDDEEQHASGASGELPSPRVSEASVRCDGTALSACDTAFTGATCDLPCLDTSGEAAPECGLDFY